MPGLKFRVLLDSEKKEEIFRDILISDTDNFESLYHAILKSFNFKGDQMASFYVSNDDWDKGQKKPFWAAWVPPPEDDEEEEEEDYL